VRIKKQMAMVFNLDKCLGCNTCTLACKNVWTNREGAEYMFWNNVETKPGIGYPKRWEDQKKHRGGWRRDEVGENPKLEQGSRFWLMINLFYNPVMPEMSEYYGKGPFTFTYEDLHSTEPTTYSQPVARPKSMISGEEDIDIEYAVNWEDNGAGLFEGGLGGMDPNLERLTPAAKDALLKFRDTFMMYLPRICNHCMNPACVGSCPSGAAYKREEDGVVLIDQDRCRGWRFCVSGCPYKKTYYNWRTGKSEKCLLCYPRIETGQPPACFTACPGRIRYMGPLLYDLDAVAEAANAPDDQLVQAQRDVILDPNDPEVIEAARAAGIEGAWLEACRRSPVYKMVKEWQVALPLHPEFRTLPSLFYIPPQSPVASVASADAPYDMIGTGIFPGLDEFRIPIEYLASLLSAGQVDVVRVALERQLAVRAFRRSERVDGKPDATVLEAVGLNVEQARELHRLLALAHFGERFVVPTTHAENTGSAPYLERGYAGYDELAPGQAPRRRTEFHGGAEGVES